jgi:hypothetical protein
MKKSEKREHVSDFGLTVMTASRKTAVINQLVIRHGAKGGLSAQRRAVHLPHHDSSVAVCQLLRQVSIHSGFPCGYTIVSPPTPACDQRREASEAEESQDP